jgi:SAM-dependent methyltransferase
MTLMTNCSARLPLPPDQVSHLTKNSDQPYQAYYSDPQWYSAYNQGKKAFYSIPEQFNDDQFYLDWANKNRCTSILDVGCGDGAKSNLLAQSGFRVVGIDNSQEMIESLINIHLNKRQNLDSVFEDPHDRGMVYVTQTKSYDETTQLLTLVKQFHFVKTQEAWSLKINFRIYYPHELELILKYNGFTVQEKFGNFDGSHFCSQSKKMIFVCRKSKESSSFGKLLANPV